MLEARKPTHQTRHAIIIYLFIIIIINILLIGLKDKYENNTDQSPISILKKGKIYQIFIFVCTESFPCVLKSFRKANLHG